ncbi:HEAT repeat-containing protein 1 homolog [Microplitis mediator]|uniref:HEAT repeat-containing protein 1 homolog n=1 Tax=Microplitis mediator TaxID=375433 RepID=UPI0025576E79|nr:HEAT repeat-containing protein 1 homolog [Microplitis mediator]XP_057330199.1 HEAT repeat-containing protein 1 homolog [Microplitis mediator]
MPTSLAAQLKKLEAPQTSLLLQDKKRPSLLFDPKEAANLDREKVFKIGKSGFDELLKQSDVFQQFEPIFFSPSSLKFERAMYTSKENKKLDAAINKFLMYLSPYFLLNTAHKTLEWLIRRFHIHEYNKDGFIMLILPYHDTRIFVRAIQLVNLTNPADKWHWLEPIQKPGVPLPSLTVANRLVCDNSFLNLLCSHVVTATETYGPEAHRLSTLYSFYSTRVIGAIDRAKDISEVQVSHLLPVLLHGLSSSIVDYTASTYMVLTQLWKKVRLDDKTIQHLLAKALKHPSPELRTNVLMLVYSIYDTPYHSLTVVSDKVVTRTAKHSWFCEETMKVRATTLDTSKFLVLLCETAVKIIVKNPAEAEKIKDMITAIFQKINFDDKEIDVILKNTLKPNLATGTLSTASKQFLSQLFSSIETRYPVCFDEYLKDLMAKSEKDLEAKEVLQFLMSWHSGAHQTKISMETLNRLYHFSAEQRIMALETLSKENLGVSDGFQELLNSSLLQRFNDDDVRVVKTLLNFPVKRLKSIFSSDVLVDQLMVLLSQCHTEKRHTLARPALKILLDVWDEGDDTSIFIATLPYLFPSRDEEVQIAMQILNSAFAKKNKYLQMVKNDVGAQADAESIGSAAFHNILNWELLPPSENVLSTMKLSDNVDATALFFNLVLLGSVCRVPVGKLSPKIAREVIEMAAKMIKQYPKVLALPNCNQLTGEKIQEALQLTSKEILPLQAGTYVLEMVHRRLDLQSNSVLDFENNPEHAQLILRTVEILFDGIASSANKAHYSWCLKIFFQRHFPTAPNLLRFLSQFFVKPVAPQTSLHCLQIALAVLNRSNSFQWIFQDKTFIGNLLIGLARPNEKCRIAALSILKRLSQTFNIAMEGSSTLLDKISDRESEIRIDHEQLPVILYSLLSPDPDVESQFKKVVRKKLQETREFLLSTILDDKVPIHITAQLLEILTHVNGPEVLQELAPKGLRLLDQLRECPDKRYTQIALSNILQRFNCITVEALKQESVWRLFDQAMSTHQLQVPLEGKSKSPSIVLLKQIDQIFFDKCSKIASGLQKKIVAKLVDIVTDCEIGTIVAAANRAVKRIKIDAQLVVDELRTMKEAKLPEEDTSAMNPARKRRSARLKQIHLRPEIINTREWKRGITVLEFIQRAENIINEELLLPVLFELLRLCLAFEEQSPLEYTNQLLLSTIYHLASKGLPISDAHQQVDLISQCIRISQNPQTHHHALLVLVQLFKIADIETALHNIMPIFTFMGSSVLRQDDAYSIQIISKTIETVVPIINATNDETHACAILRIFVVSLPDIPEHRRVPLFNKLLQLLENHLHLFYLLTFESHVLNQGKNPQDQQTSSQRLEFALTISQEFSPKTLIDVCVKLIEFMKILPIEIEENSQKRQIVFPKEHIFDVAKNTPKQLRHYRYTIVQFLSVLLSSSEFVNKVALLDDQETMKIRPHYDKLIVELILLIQSASKSADLYQGKPKEKYWKVLLHNLYDILSAVNGLLPNGVFILSVKKLMNHDFLTVRRKILELMNARLQQRKFTELDHLNLITLIDPLLQIVGKHGKMLSQEMEVVQQTSLITLKLLAKLLASEHPDQFKPVLELSTEYMAAKDGPLLGSVVLCVAELSSTMRIHAIPLMNKFMPAIIKLLKSHCHQESPDIVVISIISALQKIVESFVKFLSCYLDELVPELCRLNTLYTDPDHPKIGVIVSKLKATCEKISTNVRMSPLLRTVAEVYESFIDKKTYHYIPQLMTILADSFTTLTPAGLGAVVGDLTDFFLKVLQFREELGGSQDMQVDEDAEVLKKTIVLVEESAGKALVSLVLKLSESTFRSFYYKLYDWAARDSEFKYRNITFYRLSSSIADGLKSLFVLFAGHLLQHSALLLDQNNPAVNKPGDNTFADESSRVELIEAILSTLHKLFSYDAHNFINQARFEILAQPIVDQIENTMGTKEEFQVRARELIVPCVACFAAATEDDSLHKKLVYQTLLKTQHKESYVRNTALSAVVEIARKLGEDFMPFLPETIPFLAELLEDGEREVEKATQNAVRTLEEILGEPLQKYF